MGLQPFTDPTPWQLLSRKQQTEFYRKFLALPLHLQEQAQPPRKAHVHLRSDRT